ncbi:MAG TPA: cupin domain-containing protein [Tepidisphaeraceae bacterium]|jgi:mannose-6-phosphate isomerase-like protein (cupin superfamily)
MQHINTVSRRRRMFDVLMSSASAQAAMMTLRSGQSSSEESENEHPHCEQWLYVVRGTGRAIVGKQRTILRPHSLLLIEKNQPHQITCTGRSSLVTLNFYVPPAYTSSGELRRSAH